jgi:tight adherence protein B
MALAGAVFVAVALLIVPPRIAVMVGAVALATVIHPLLGLAAVGCGVSLHQVRRIRRVRADARDVASDGILAVELVGLGVTAGLPFRNAASMTADQIGGPVGDEISRALRSVAAGQHPDITPPTIRSMFNSAKSSEGSGMPLAGQLNAAAVDRRRAAAAVERELLARLPVKMLFPLAFLILPGFVLLTVVPPLMSGLSKLSI